MFEQPPRYFTYILRFWEEREGGTQNVAWRLSLEDTSNNTRYGFHSLAELLTFLDKLMAGES